MRRKDVVFHSSEHRFKSTPRLRRLLSQLLLVLHPHTISQMYVMYVGTTSATYHTLLLVYNPFIFTKDTNTFYKGHSTCIWYLFRPLSQLGATLFP